MGSTITAETIIDGNNTTNIEYFYDSYGPYGFSIDGAFYYYVKNLQGDVTQIRDVNNNLIASYVYDAWGKVLSVTENNSNNIGAKNAIRYRGYYYSITKVKTDYFTDRLINLLSSLAQILCTQFLYYAFHRLNRVKIKK